MKIKIIESNGLSSESERHLKDFVDAWVDKYWAFTINEEIIGPDDIVQYQHQYHNKREAKESLLHTFQNAIFNIEIDELIDDIDINSSHEKGLSMYLKIYFNIEDKVSDYNAFMESYGDLSLFEIRVSDHKPLSYTGFDKNIIVRGTTINLILPRIQTFVNNRVNRIKQSIQEYNESKA